MVIENNMKIHLKLNIELPCDPAIQFLGIFPKEMKSVCQKDISTPMWIKSLFTNNQEMKTTPGSLTANGRRRHKTQTQWKPIQLLKNKTKQKKADSVFYENMNGLGAHFD